MLAGERPTIFGDGTKTRDYVYVADIVAANLLAMAEKRAAGRIYNLGLGAEVSDRRIFESVRETIGVTVEPILASKRPGEIDRICLDASLAKTELGWEPTISLEEGIARRVQTGNIVYRINRAHGLQYIGKEDDADAVEGNQCHGSTNAIDCGLGEQRVHQE